MSCCVLGPGHQQFVYLPLVPQVGKLVVLAQMAVSVVVVTRVDVLIVVVVPAATAKRLLGLTPSGSETPD